MGWQYYVRIGNFEGRVRVLVSKIVKRRYIDERERERERKEIDDDNIRVDN
jgi:hypothetical protein